MVKKQSFRFGIPMAQWKLKNNCKIRIVSTNKPFDLCPMPHTPDLLAPISLENVSELDSSTNDKTEENFEETNLRVVVYQNFYHSLNQTIRLETYLRGKKI